MSETYKDSIIVDLQKQIKRHLKKEGKLQKEIIATQALNVNIVKANEKLLRENQKLQKKLELTEKKVEVMKHIYKTHHDDTEEYRVSGLALREILRLGKQLEKLDKEIEALEKENK